MKRIALLTALVAAGPGGPATASECSLEVAGDRHEFEHVHVTRQANAFSDGDDYVVRCFREVIPDDEAGAQGPLGFQPASGLIEIQMASSGHVTSVQVRAPELTASVSGVGFGVSFDGQLDDRAIRGRITTDEALTSLHDGERTAPFRVSATLDSPLANGSGSPGGR